MMPYFLLIILPFFAAFSELFISRRKSDAYVLLIFICFVLIVGFTDGNGLDWYGTSTNEGYGLINYREQGFQEIKHFEPGFVLINILLGNFHLFLIISSILCFLIVWVIIKRECRYRYIGLFVYLATMTLYCYMGVYRHAIAQTLIIYSWRYYNQSRKQFLIILLACTFHYAALIGLLYLIISKFNTVLSIKACFIALIIGFLVRPYILPFLQLISIFMPGETAGKLDLYVYSDDINVGFSYTYLIFKLFVFLVAYFNIDKNEKRNIFFLNTFAISIIMFCVLCIRSTFARFVMFFSCTEIVLVPLTISYLTNGKQKLINKYSYFLVVGMTYIYMYLSSLYSFSEIYFPYKSILF